MNSSLVKSVSGKNLS
jgi:hypothetical protein